MRFRDFRNDDLVRVAGMVAKAIKQLKERRAGHSLELPNYLLLADDVADDPAVVRHSNFVLAFVLYRHQNLSCAILSKKNGNCCRQRSE